MKSQPKNIAASIRQKLLNRAKADNRTFNEVLQFAIINFHQAYIRE